jgi:hypothetical protein
MKHFLLLACTALGLLAADATGKWSGTLTPADRDAGPALLILKQDGNTVSGTAGPDESERHEITNGRIEDGSLKFEVPQGEAVMKFDLRLDGDEIKGDVSRERNGQKQTAKLTLKRDK